MPIKDCRALQLKQEARTVQERRADTAVVSYFDLSVVKFLFDFDLKLFSYCFLAIANIILTLFILFYRILTSEELNLYNSSQIYSIKLLLPQKLSLPCFFIRAYSKYRNTNV